MNIGSKYKLNNSVEIPYLGLGTWQMKAGKETYQCVQYALEIGYRHIDTATIYLNEQDVGKAVNESGIPRNEIFITTKLWNNDQGYERTLKAFDKSLKKLNLEYIDLYLIHWPVEGKRIESYKALEKLYSEGICKSIGVSNYTIKHLEELISAVDIIPQANQVEFHPFLYQNDLLEYCNSKNIAIEAYSPLVRGKRAKHPTLTSIANKYGKTWAQILIRWSLQHNLIVLPKSSQFDRIKENADVFDFELSAEDMNALDNIDDTLRTCWDPTGVE